MPKISMIDQTGKKVKDITLLDTVWGIEPNKSVLFDAITMQRASLRQGTHKTKTRTEVRGGGRKPWKQKGTGNARQGTIRAPQWVGGGIVFGPTPRSYKYSLNKKVRRLALKSALSMKVIDKNVVVLNDLVFENAKTKDAVAMFSNIKADGKILVVTDGINENVSLSLRNIPKVTYIDALGVNVLDVVHHNTVVFTQAAVAKLEEVLG